ncbi:GNAT family N-acetyltransferase [Pseudovibrio exalbescens]|uniref:GNAT family N-acetyltransferase n=1 Tax=Pseudovibrio exalbescens TaxID=197461 RepID=UPI000C9B3A50|nr:GNAT family N-acetyltransferase [Pseudovibrio exalbescens]
MMALDEGCFASPQTGTHQIAVSLGTVENLNVSIRQNWADVRGDWQAIMARFQTCPFQDTRWKDAWFHTGGSSRNACSLFVVLHEGPDLVGVLPLYKRQFAGHNVLAWQGDDVNDYCVPLLAPHLQKALSSEACEEILRRVAQHVGGVHALLLRGQPTLVRGGQNPFAHIGNYQDTGIAHYLLLAGPWQPFYAALRGKNTRRRLSQKLRKLKNHGTVRFKGLRRTDDRLKALDLMLTWKANQLDERGSRNPFRTLRGEKTILTRQLEAVVGKPESCASVRLYGLFVGDQMIAGFLCLTQNGDFSVLINAYDKEAYSEHSPGQLLLVQTMELATRAGMTSYDLMRGDEPYKREWVRDHTILKDSVVPLTFRGKALKKLHHLIQSGKRAALQRPRMMAFLHAANRRRGRLVRFFSEGKGRSEAL